MSNESQTVPFGKYKGQPLEVLIADKSYTAWLVAQDWFRERYQSIYQAIVNYSPGLNAMLHVYQCEGYEEELAEFLAAVHKAAGAHGETACLIEHPNKNVIDSLTKGWKLPWTIAKNVSITDLYASDIEIDIEINSYSSDDDEKQILGIYGSDEDGKWRSYINVDFVRQCFEDGEKGRKRLAEFLVPPKKTYP
ncbi:MAG: hypothetical protein LBC63_03105 [Holophagales bacterium]|jgi:hypothetical protein|nr:hypothetical protein [Holophagales bacterium]